MGRGDKADDGAVNLTVEVDGTEKNAAENHVAFMGMEVEVCVDMGGGVLLGLEVTRILSQEADPVGTTLADDCNRFNKLSRLVILWMMWHHCPAGARCIFNRYKHWAQILLSHPGSPLVTILIIEVVTKGEPLSMVRYRINLIPLAAELQSAYPGFTNPFYAYDAAFDI